MGGARGKKWGLVKKRNEKKYKISQMLSPRKACCRVQKKGPGQHKKVSVIKGRKATMENTRERRKRYVGAVSRK